MSNGQGSENMSCSNSSDIYNINNINSNNIHSQYLDQGLQTQEPSKQENSFPQGKNKFEQKKDSKKEKELKSEKKKNVKNEEKKSQNIRHEIAFIDSESINKLGSRIDSLISNVDSLVQEIKVLNQNKDGLLKEIKVSNQNQTKMIDLLVKKFFLEEK